MSTTNFSAFSSLLDSTLEDLADLPEFKTPPNGAHTAKFISIEAKRVGDADALEFKFKIIESQELADPSEAPAEPGSEFATIAVAGNEFFEGNVKAILSPVAAHFGLAKTGDVIALINSDKPEVIVVTKQVRSKKDKDKVFINVTNLAVI